MPFEKDSFAREKGLGQSLTHKKSTCDAIPKKETILTMLNKQPKNSHYKTAADK